jgi:uncharacterized protein (TIGR02246 family)
MARFTAEQSQAYVEIQQLIHDWGYELDHCYGENIGDLLAEDCTYFLAGTPREGRAQIVAYYADRLARLGAASDGVPVHRHAICNLRVMFSAIDAAAITFNLTYFTAAGHPLRTDHADPASYADVRMEVRREADGHWRIAHFDSGQAFRRLAK